MNNSRDMGMHLHDAHLAVTERRVRQVEELVAKQRQVVSSLPKKGRAGRIAGELLDEYEQALADQKALLSRLQGRSQNIGGR